MKNLKGTIKLKKKYMNLYPDLIRNIKKLNWKNKIGIKVKAAKKNQKESSKLCLGIETHQVVKENQVINLTELHRREKNLVKIRI